VPHDLGTARGPAKNPFAWGDAILGYRHLGYDFRDDRPVSSLTFSGPIVGIGFNF
jgi:hypothetical protein